MPIRTNYIIEMPTKSLKPKRIGQLRCKRPTIAIENLIQSPLRRGGIEREMEKRVRQRWSREEKRERERRDIEEVEERRGARERERQIK